MTSFTPIEGLVGGVMIGLAIVIWLGLYGRVVGISGIFGGALFTRTTGERSWRAMYLAGLIVGAFVYFAIERHLPGTYYGVTLEGSWPLMLVAGLLVGFGTRLGHGCTSGHGVCGIARLSGRSFVATGVFLVFGFIAASLLRRWLGL